MIFGGLASFFMKGGEGVTRYLLRFAIAVLAGVVANAIWHLLDG